MLLVVIDNWSGAILLWLATNEAEAEDTPVEVLLLDVLATQLTVVPTTSHGPVQGPAPEHGYTRNTIKIAVRTEPSILVLLASQFYWSF